MNKILATTCMLALCAGGATAAGLDRSGQGNSILFEEGGYVELSYGLVSPSVTGTIGGVVGSGNMAANYSQFGIAVKTDINSKLSFALIMDQPFGANVDYPASAAPYPFNGTTAEIKSNAVTAMVRYKFSDRMSVHGGLRYQSISGVASIPVVGGYTLDVTGSGGSGYALGAAYEIPDIALRVAVTYNSEIAHTMTGSEFGALPSSFDIVTPKSINLDFQSGIAADTLIFGSIRWVNWSSFDISPPAYVGATGAPLVSYANDATTYSLGVGRKFSDTFSGSISVGYEASKGGIASNLAPTDGNWSISLGGKYTKGNMVISGGVRYVSLGDATTSVGASFADNSAIGLGIKVGYSF